MSNTTILYHSTPNELVESFKSVLKEVLKENQPNLESKDKLLTREEVCRLLSINKTTLWTYTKKGKLISYGIGNRVFYKMDEVIEAIKPLKK